MIKQTAPKLNASVEALRRWVEQANIDAGIKPGVRSDSQEEIKRLKRENATTAARQRDSHHCVSVFRRGAGPAHTEMIAYIDTYRDIFGVELICRTLGATEGGFITSRGYRASKTRPASDWQLREAILIPVVERIRAENYGVYGTRKLWQAMLRQGWQIGRDQVA